MFSKQDLEIADPVEFCSFLLVLPFVGLVLPFLGAAYTLGLVLDLVGWMDT